MQVSMRLFSITGFGFFMLLIIARCRSVGSADHIGLGRGSRPRRFLNGRCSPTDYIPTLQQPDHILQLDELRRQINEIIRTLPMQAQRVFIMSRFDGRSHAEIAQELQINHKTVESHITRALSSLRVLLRQEFCLLLFGYLTL